MYSERCLSFSGKITGVELEHSEVCFCFSGKTTGGAVDTPRRHGGVEIEPAHSALRRQAELLTEVSATGQVGTGAEDICEGEVQQVLRDSLLSPSSVLKQDS